MSLTGAIRWRWPEAQVVIRGAGVDAVIERWDGAVPRPTDPEIAQAMSDYETQRVAEQELREREIGQIPLQAVVWALQEILGEMGYTGTLEQTTTRIRAKFDEIVATRAGDRAEPGVRVTPR